MPWGYMPAAGFRDKLLAALEAEGVAVDHLARDTHDLLSHLPTTG